jgi:hypothetical protein
MDTTSPLCIHFTHRAQRTCKMWYVIQFSTGTFSKCILCDFAITGLDIHLSQTEICNWQCKSKLDRYLNYLSSIQTVVMKKTFQISEFCIICHTNIVGTMNHFHISNKAGFELHSWPILIKIKSVGRFSVHGRHIKYCRHSLSDLGHGTLSNLTLTLTH